MRFLLSIMPIRKSIGIFYFYPYFSIVNRHFQHFSPFYFPYLLIFGTPFALNKDKRVYYYQITNGGIYYE